MAEKNNAEIVEFDNMLAGLYKDLTAIRVKEGAVIDAIQFVYGNRETKLYGGPGGTQNEFKLKKDEHITKLYIVKGTYEDYPTPVICYLTFYTDKDRTFSCGSKTGCKDRQEYYDEPDAGNYIRSFYGSYGRYLTDINSYYRKNGLTKFNDVFFAQDKTRISEIKIAGGAVVDSIQIIYDGNQPAKKHGGNGGSLKTLKLQEGEYITEISGKFGNYRYRGPDTLCTVTITTNLNNTISGGNAQFCSDLTPFYYSAEKNRQIFAISGNHSVYMGKLWVGMYALINETPYYGRGTLLNDMADDLKGGTLTKAINGGYFSQRELKTMIDNTIKAAEKGGIVERVLTEKAYQIQTTNVTKTVVNTTQIVFRATDIPQEINNILENMTLYSKAQRRKAHQEPVIDIATQNTTQADYATVLRIAAIKASYEPPSQFVSIALNMECANRFKGMSKTVYAFEIIPNSPVLGLDSPGVVGKGEDQLQILGNTPIINLFRYPDNSEKWQIYHYNKATKTGVWKETSLRPVNKEYNELMKRDDPGDL